MEKQQVPAYLRYRIIVLVAVLFFGLYFLLPENEPTNTYSVPAKIEKIRETVFKKDSSLIVEKLRLEKALLKVSKSRDSLRQLTIRLSNRQMIRVIADTSKNITPVVFQNNLGLFLDSVAIKNLAQLKIDVDHLSKEKSLTDSLYRNALLSKLAYQKAYDDTYHEFSNYRDSVHVANKKSKRRNFFTKITSVAAGFAIGRIKL